MNKFQMFYLVNQGLQILAPIHHCSLNITPPNKMPLVLQVTARGLRLPSPPPIPPLSLHSFLMHPSHSPALYVTSVSFPTLVSNPHQQTSSMFPWHVTHPQNSTSPLLEDRLNPQAHVQDLFCERHFVLCWGCWGQRDTVPAHSLAGRNTHHISYHSNNFFVEIMISTLNKTDINTNRITSATLRCRLKEICFNTVPPKHI